MSIIFCTQDVAKGHVTHGARTRAPRVLANRLVLASLVCPVGYATRCANQALGPTLPQHLTSQGIQVAH